MQVLPSRRPILENASLYRLLSQTRDLWQSAFHRSPRRSGPRRRVRVVPANPAFLTLGAFDLATIIGSSFRELLEGPSTPDGRRVNGGGGGGAARRTPDDSAAQRRVRRDAGPLRGGGAGGGGSVWVLRKIPRTRLLRLRHLEVART